jgi:hypothetical protein
LSQEIAEEYNTNLRILDAYDFEQRKESEAFQKTGSERIVSLDFQRGLAIWLVTFLHSFERLYDYTWVKEDPDAIMNLPPMVLIIGLFVGFLASWNAYFLLISSIVNSYAAAKNKNASNKKLAKIFYKQLLTGIGLVIAGMITAGFGLDGYFDVALRTGNWSEFSIIYRSQFRMTTLHIIGYCLIINSVMRLLLLRNNGQRKFKRNMSIYGLLALAIIIASPFVHNWVDNMPWNVPENPPADLGDPTSWPNKYFQGYNASPKAYIMMLLAGDYQPLFPYLATSFIGAMIGLSLAKNKINKRLPLIGGLISITFMALGGMLVALGFFNASNGRPALGNYFLMLGGQIGLVMLFLRLVEYRGRSERFANRSVVKHLRLWSIISLSVFSLGLIEILPKFLLSKFITWAYKPMNFVEKSVFGLGKEHLALAVSVYVIAFFEVAVYLWSKVNFKYSFEWFIIHFASIGSKVKSRRLDVQIMMKKNKYVNYKYLLQANEITEKINLEKSNKFMNHRLKLRKH